MDELLTMVPVNIDMMDYDQAIALRLIAEQSTNPQEYEIAAAAFMTLGLLACAESCHRRAEHYRKVLQRGDAMSLSQICESILHVLDANGGRVAGTIHLARTVYVDEHNINRSLNQLQRSGLIKSSRSRCGRGQKSIHQLTQKGREHVRSK
jgi:DNA-binding MarR family transcriptional regulator